MDEETRMLFQLLEEGDEEAQYKSFVLLLEEMEEPVEWVDDVWDLWVNQLKATEPEQRAQAGQFLAYLAISMDENQIEEVFDKIWEITYEDRFVQSRNVLQATWRLGLVGKDSNERLLKKYEERFKEAGNEKHGTLIRFDITRNMRQLYDKMQDIEIKQRSLYLIELEDSQKYKRKYEKVWA